MLGCEGCGRGKNQSLFWRMHASTQSLAFFLQHTRKKNSKVLQQKGRGTGIYCWSNCCAPDVVFGESFVLHLVKHFPNLFCRLHFLCESFGGEKQGSCFSSFCHSFSANFFIINVCLVHDIIFMEWSGEINSDSSRGFSRDFWDSSTNFAEKLLLN